MKKDTMQIDQQALDLLMPMHLWLSAEGSIVSVGATLRKTFFSTLLDGQGFFDLFEVRRPGGIFTVEDLLRRAGERLSILPKGGKELFGLRAMAVPLAKDGAVLLNLSFGIGVVEAVNAYQLTDADFSVTDLAMELLYLVEAKTAVTEELRQLNQRLQGARDAAQEQAMTDRLTGLRNRRALDFAMQEMIDHQTPFGVMHIDLDFFKAVNDSLGHAAGDHVLREVAKVLLSETRIGDTVARSGGDEFVILFYQVTDAEKLTRIAERVIERLSAPSAFQDKEYRISASIGITISTSYIQPEAEKMSRDADTALYASKNSGRGKATLFRASPPERRNLG